MFKNSFINRDFFFLIIFVPEYFCTLPIDSHSLYLYCISVQSSWFVNRAPFWPQNQSNYCTGVMVVMEMSDFITQPWENMGQSLLSTVSISISKVSTPSGAESLLQSFTFTHWHTFRNQL